MATNREILRAGYFAGKGLYGESLIWRSGGVTFRKLSDRIADMLDNDVDPIVAGIIDDYEFAFNMQGVGMEASGEWLTEATLHDQEHLLLYDPEFGIDVLHIDMSHEEMIDMIANRIMA